MAASSRTYSEWRTLVTRGIPEGKSIKHPLTDEKYERLYDLGTLSHYVTWYLVTGRCIGGVDAVVKVAS